MEVKRPQVYGGVAPDVCKGRVLWVNVREVLGVCNHVFVETADGQWGLGDPGECMCAEG